MHSYTLFISSYRSIALSQLFCVALVSGVALGLANPTLGCLAHKYGLSKVSTFGIFLISGMMLNAQFT